MERAAVAGSVAMHRIRRREGERWMKLAAFLKDSPSNWKREKLSGPLCRARNGRSLPLSPQKPACTWSSLHSRARFNRACVRRALASLSTTSMLFLQRGGVNPAGRPLSSIASRALRAVVSASRISPLRFDGDKRGRMRQFDEAVAFDQKF